MHLLWIFICVKLYLPKVRFLSDFIAIMEAVRMMMSGGETNEQEYIGTNRMDDEPTDCCPLWKESKKKFFIS